MVGHSFIKWAAIHANKRHFGNNLGLTDRGVQITWRGKGGMLWSDLRQVLNEMVTGGVTPDVLVLHLGENDLGNRRGIMILKDMKEDMQEIGKRWAGTHIMWTEWVPRRKWRGAIRPAAIDRARRKVNAEMRGFCRQRGFGMVEHKGIIYKEAGFFRDDGVHLSLVGLEMYLLNLREAVAAALGVEPW